MASSSQLLAKPLKKIPTIDTFCDAQANSVQDK